MYKCLGFSWDLSNFIILNKIQDKEVKASVQFIFPYFLKMCRKYKRTINYIPSKIYVNFC